MRAKHGSERLGLVHVRLAAIDVLLLSGSFMIWLFVGIVDLRAHAIGTLVRVLALHLHVWAMLEPVRRWRARGEAADEPTLLAADASVQGLPRRLGLSYLLGWAGLQAFDLLVVLVAPRPGETIAAAELLSFSIISLAALMVCVALMAAAAAFMVHEQTAAVSRALYERRLSPPRPRRSLDVTLRRFFSAFTAAVLMGIVIAGGKARVDGIREQTLASTQARVVVAAAQLRARLEPTGVGGERPDEGDMSDLAIVDVDELPVALGPGVAGGELVSVFEPRRERVIAAAPIGDGRWVLGEARPPEQLGLLAAFAIALGAIVGTLAGIAAMALSRSISTPLAELGAASRRMAEAGELGALTRVVPQRNDEVGDLVADFNAMLDMFEDLGAAATAVADGDLCVTLDHPGDVHDAFRAMVAQLRVMVGQLRATALEVASATAEIQASTQAHERAAAHQREIVRDASATVASLATAAQTISEMADAVHNDAEQSLATTTEVAAEIRALGGLASGIAELLDSIREIADRSDLLALNGALEATRAGELGRGFALVAGEMRRLAERVSGSVADIGARIAAIEAAGAGTVVVTERSRALAERTVETAGRISALTREQSRDTGRASSATEAMASFVVESGAGIAQTHAIAESLRGQVAELERLTRQFELGEDL